MRRLRVAVVLLVVMWLGLGVAVFAAHARLDALEQSTLRVERTGDYEAIRLGRVLVWSNAEDAGVVVISRDGRLVVPRWIVAPSPTAPQSPIAPHPPTAPQSPIAPEASQPEASQPEAQAER